MKRFFYGSLVSLMVILLFAGCAMAADAGVEVVQTPANVVEGQDFQIDIYINPNCDDFYGLSYNLVFDPADVKVLSGGQLLDEGTGAVVLDASLENTHLFQEGINSFNNTTGNIKFAALRMGQTQGVSITTKTLAASFTCRAVSAAGLNPKFAPYNAKISDLGLAEDKCNCLIQLSNAAAEPISYSSPDMRCFIATAAYGSYLDPHVQSLRDFRDRYLMPSSWGRFLVNFYYNNSPPLANLISQHLVLRTAARIMLTPIVFGVVYPRTTALILFIAGILWLVLRRQKKGRMIKHAGIANLFAIFIIFCVLSFYAGQAEAVIPAGYSPDLNSDAKVNAADILYLAQYYGNGSLTAADLYDVNQDTVADLYDMVEISTKFTPEPAPIIIDHNTTNLQSIPPEAINAAKENLNIYYGHTSHGSQLITGMQGLISFKSDLYAFGNVKQAGSLYIYEYGGDLGLTGDTAWANTTRNYLNAHGDINVVMWSWCGGCSGNTQAGINTYLNTMSQLEIDYPGVKFVYMTGHLDGSGLEGNLHQRNEQIRNYCRENNKILYDFADIETYDPSGTYFGDKYPDDGCVYDKTSRGSRDGNWAVEWQNAHTEGFDWYNCDAAHTQPLNANQKAYAAWWLFARMAGWSGE